MTPGHAAVQWRVQGVFLTPSLLKPELCQGRLLHFGVELMGNSAWLFWPLKSRSKFQCDFLGSYLLRNFRHDRAFASATARIASLRSTPGYDPACTCNCSSFLVHRQLLHHYMSVVFVTKKRQSCQVSCRGISGSAKGVCNPVSTSVRHFSLT